MLRFILISILVILSVTPIFAAPTQQFFFFGDSLTDSGYQNNNPVVKQENKTPIWTSPHGHTWAYYFLKNYAQQSHHHITLLPNNVTAATFFHPIPANILPTLDGNNFAAGGATTQGPGMLNKKEYKSPSLLNQTNYFINIYAPQHAISVSKPIYFVWSGTNDLMKKIMIEIAVAEWLKKAHLDKLALALHLFDLKTLSKRFIKTQTRIANNLLTAVTTLQKAHAKKIIIILLPDIGDGPLMNVLAQSLQKKGYAYTATQLSTEMHAVTKRTNELIRTKLANSNVLLIDVNPILKSITSMKTPGVFQEKTPEFDMQNRFIIANNKGSACKANQQALSCIPSVANATHYVFEDIAHPTDQTHRIIGDYVYSQSKQYLHW